MITSAAWAGKRYGVFGLARTGRSVCDALLASGAEVWAWDDDSSARDNALAELVNLNTAPLETLDGLVLSPGVPLNSHRLAKSARNEGCPIIGDVELFALARAGLPRGVVAGITGTNGKSTTAALLHHIVRTAGRPALLGGNIGAPILSENALPEGGVYVLELSSFQIDLTFSLACNVAIFLNVTPDHLDRYDGIEAYAASKRRLFAMQDADAVAVIATDDMWTRAAATRVQARLVEASGKRLLKSGISVVGGTVYRDGSAFGAQSAWAQLQGVHNAQNAAAAIAAALALDIDESAIREGLDTYPGLPHRMEIVATKQGVRFVNDSKATNPASAAPALSAYKQVHWIAGGQGKSDSLDEVVPYLPHVRAAYLIGDAAPMFARLLEGRVPVRASGTLAQAVADAAAAAKPGDTVLLSPACASFDQFRNYEERGAAFSAAVEALA